jgi:2-keto-4-pentenoate hydratase/2-oxohepta-3-ene-1,7-dioic acid hydratase in catechol pathway
VGIIGTRRFASREGPFGLGRFSGSDGAFTGLVVGEAVAPLSYVRHDLSDRLSPVAVLARWDELAGDLSRAAGQVARGGLGAQPVASLRRLTPVEPRQLLAAGLNYRTHVIDLMVDGRIGSRPGMSVDEIRAEATAVMDERTRSGVPFLWVGLPTSVCGPDDDIVLRADSERTDWELELAAVIGAPARDVPRDRALSCVAGWTVANDLTARDFVGRDDLGPVGADWLQSKCAPTYKPIGPYLVPAALVDDPQALQIQLRLNGELMQDETTADMIFDVASLIAFASRQAQLLPGDVVLTGSPAGNGSHYDRWLRPGDVMEGSITGLGTQRNRVVSA